MMNVFVQCFTQDSTPPLAGSMSRIKIGLHIFIQKAAKSKQMLRLVACRIEQRPLPHAQNILSRSEALILLADL